MDKLFTTHLSFYHYYLRQKKKERGNKDMQNKTIGRNRCIKKVKIE